MQKHDLSATFPQGAFDLVTAQHLHSPVEMDRAAVLRRAAAAVGPDGQRATVTDTVITAVRRGAADGGDHFSQATPSPSRSSPGR